TPHIRFGSTNLAILEIMAPNFDFIDEINPFKETWKIKVKITTLWSTYKFNSHEEIFSIDMILVDEKELVENEDMDNNIKEDEHIQFMDHDTVSITCSTSSSTPLKKTLAENEREEELSADATPAQHSSNKMKKIKIEKE
ncbi:hypothetical protein Taro_022598, partial [Colocasia esculenta]|nr:hypothetical protein [Colocasia esculenta]